MLSVNTLMCSLRVRKRLRPRDEGRCWRVLERRGVMVVNCFTTDSAALVSSFTVALSCFRVPLRLKLSGEHLSDADQDGGRCRNYQKDSLRPSCASTASSSVSSALDWPEIGVSGSSVEDLVFWWDSSDLSYSRFRGQSFLWDDSALIQRSLREKIRNLYVDLR